MTEIETKVQTTCEQKIKNILNRAKQEKIKGRYYVYERYKAELQDACGFGESYTLAAIELAHILKV